MVKNTVCTGSRLGTVHSRRLSSVVRCPPHRQVKLPVRLRDAVIRAGGMSSLGSAAARAPSSHRLELAAPWLLLSRGVVKRRGRPMRGIGNLSGSRLCWGNSLTLEANSVSVLP